MMPLSLEKNHVLKHIYFFKRHLTLVNNHAPGDNYSDPPFCRRRMRTSLILVRNVHRNRTVGPFRQSRAGGRVNR